MKLRQNKNGKDLKIETFFYHGALSTLIKIYCREQCEDPDAHYHSFCVTITEKQLVITFYQCHLPE